MPETTNYSSKLMLEKLTPQKDNGEYDSELFQQLQKEIEDKMEEFDLEKRIKAAKAMEDLGKLVITA